MSDYSDLELEQLKRELHDANATLIEMACLLKHAREYMLYKAGRHDLNWRDAHNIIDKIDYLFELGTVRDIQATQ